MNRSPGQGLTADQRRRHSVAAVAKSAAGCGSPKPEAQSAHHSMSGAFYLPGIMCAGVHVSSLWRAVRGGRKARRSSGRSSNRVPSVTSCVEAGVAVSHLLRTMP